MDITEIIESRFNIKIKTKIFKEDNTWFFGDEFDLENDALEYVQDFNRNSILNCLGESAVICRSSSLANPHFFDSE